MRVGLFTDTYYPQINGVATSVFLLKKYLEKQGHEVFVCTTSDPQAEVELENNIYRTLSIPFVSERRFGAFYSARLAELAASHRPDIIHTHTEFPLGVFGRTLAHNFHVPHVHTYHTIYEDYTHFIVKFGSLDTVARAATRVMSRVYCNSANQVIVPTDKVNFLLKSYGVVRPIQVVPTGVEIERFAPAQFTPEQRLAVRRELGLLPEHFVLLNIGRVSEEKNLAELIYFSAPLLRLHSEWRLVFVGNGPELNEYRALAAELGLEGQIIFAGARAWDSIGLYYQVGDVFVSASQSETQGLTYIEAMAAGLPVLARRDPCLNLVIEEGKNGFMYDLEEEFQRYAEMLFTLRQNAELHAFEAEALLRAQRFGADEFARRIVSLYRDVKASFTDNIMG